MKVVVAPDKFRGTATGLEAAQALAAGVRSAGANVVCLPMADGGEGTLDAFGGPNQVATVTGPLGEPVEAAWRLAGGTAIIEACLANGLLLAGGRDRNSPLEATTRGVGELVAQALSAGAVRVIVAVGGSASTDGGRGAIDALAGVPFAVRAPGVDVVVACDVRTLFCDAARTFGPQKGASADDVLILDGRLNAEADRFLSEYGVKVRELPGAGAAGGLAGGMAALGARLIPGADLVAQEIGLPAAIADADLILTGEGALDAPSFDGKVVGTVARLAAQAGVPVTAIVGTAIDGLRVADELLKVVRLDLTFGIDAALHETMSCLTAAGAYAVRAEHPNLASRRQIVMKQAMSEEPAPSATIRQD